MSCDQSSSNESDEASATSKAGDETEELPGYLVRPENIQVVEVSGETDHFTISADAGVLESDDGSFSGVFVTIWGILAGSQSSDASFNVKLLSGGSANTDGSFSFEVNAGGFGELIVQVGSQNPGLFALNVSEDNTSNSALIRPFEAGFTPSFLTNTTSSIFMTSGNDIAPEKANRVSLFYTNLNTAPSSDTIEARLEIFNISNEVLNLGSHKIHYFMTDDGLTPEFVVTSDTTIPEGVVFYTYNENGADSYLSILINGDHYVEPGASAILSFRISNTESSTFDQSDDRSFLSDQTQSGVSEKIFIYDSVNDKIWGE